MPLCQSLRTFAAISTVGNWWSGVVELYGVTDREVSLHGTMALFQDKTGSTVTPDKKERARFGAGNVKMTCIKQTTHLMHFPLFQNISAALTAQHGITFAEVQVWMLEFWRSWSFCHNWGSVETWMMNGWILCSLRIDRPHILFKTPEGLKCWTSCF